MLNYVKLRIDMKTFALDSDNWRFFRYAFYLLIGATAGMLFVLILFKM